MTTELEKQIMDAARSAIQKLQSDKRQSREPVNWGDLSAAIETEIHVVIEEAAPGSCPELCHAVWQAIKDATGLEVHVRTEW